MTFEELLKQCANGKMPRVIYNGKVCEVVTIKNADGYYGVGVNTGNKYVDWFYAEPGNDKRKKYISELSPVDEYTEGGREDGGLPILNRVKGMIKYDDCSMPITDVDKLRKHGIAEYNKAIQDIIDILKQ